MKERIFAGSLVIFSVFAWIIGSFIYNIVVQPQSISNTQKQTIVKEWSFTTITELETEITKLVSQVGPSVVNIIIKKELDVFQWDPWGFFQQKVGSEVRQVGGWSGFFVTKDGVIMTNKHVVGDPNASYTVITNDGTQYEAKVVALDPLTDIAIIKIENPENKTFQTLDVIENEESIKIGQFAVAIWNALWEFQNSVAFWVISGKNRSIEAGSQGSNSTEQLSGLLQTDAAINPGNSGWPLINLDGKLMWVNTAIAGWSQGLGFSIPMTQKRISYILDSIQKFNEIKRPFIGVLSIPLTENIATRYGLQSSYGWYIPDEANAIVPDSPAQKAWLEVWDIILEVNGNKVTYATPLPVLIQNNIPGDTLQLKVLKKSGKTVDVSLVLGQN